MLNELKVLSDHGRQYISDLRNRPVSEKFRGRPVISGDITGDEIKEVSAMCPAGAIDARCGAIDMGKCLFCNECALMLSHRILFTNDYRIAANIREDLIVRPGQTGQIRLRDSAVRREIRHLFSKALKLREVSAAGDNSCEMELTAAGNVNFDMGRFGIEFVASPRHADGIVITGPVSENMAEALTMTYDAIPDPKIIILAGTDAISGGLFAGSRALNRKFISEHTVDLYVPGNPAHPLAFINGVLDLVGI